MSDLFYPKFQELIDALSKAVGVPMQAFELGEGLVSYEYENTTEGRTFRTFFTHLFPYVTCKLLIIRKAPTINTEEKHLGFTIVTTIKSSDVYFSPSDCRFGVSYTGPVKNTLTLPELASDLMHQVFLSELNKYDQKLKLVLYQIGLAKRNMQELEGQEEEIKSRSDLLTALVEKSK